MKFLNDDLSKLSPIRRTFNYAVGGLVFLFVGIGMISSLFDQENGCKQAKARLESSETKFDQYVRDKAEQQPTVDQQMISDVYNQYQSQVAGAQAEVSRLCK